MVDQRTITGLRGKWESAGTGSGDDGAARTGEGAGGVEEVRSAKEYGHLQRGTVSAEGNLFELTRLRMQPPPEPVDPHAIRIEPATCLGLNGESGPAPGEVVVVAPGGQQ